MTVVVCFQHNILVHAVSVSKSTLTFSKDMQLILSNITEEPRLLVLVTESSHLEDCISYGGNRVPSIEKDLVS